MKFSHIGLTCADLERSEEFYRDLFGFETFFRIRRKTRWLAATVGYPSADVEFLHMRGCGGLHLELLKYWSEPGVPRLRDDTFCPGNMHFSLLVEDAEEIASSVRLWWVSHSSDWIGGSKFASNPLDIEASTVQDGPNKGDKGFYMRDPDGHTIEVSQQSNEKDRG